MTLAMARRKLAKQTTFKKDNPKILTSAKLYSAILENPKVKESKRNLTLASKRLRKTALTRSTTRSS